MIYSGKLILSKTLIHSVRGTDSLNYSVTFLGCDSFNPLVTIEVNNSFALFGTIWIVDSFTYSDTFANDD